MSLLTRVLELLSGLNDSAFRTISIQGRVVGALARDAGGGHFSWFGIADPRLRNHQDPVTDDLGALTGATGARLGAPVSLVVG